MNRKILLLGLLIQLVTSQTIEEVLISLQDLNTQNKNYKRPTNYSEFYYPHFTDEGLYGEYDFIIIGGGAAGTMLANRLSEISEWKILLLEAGHNETLYTDIPAMVGALQFSNFNWGYQTVPQKRGCLGMQDKQCNIPRGKVLGGSTTINYMIYARGNKQDYDNWAKAGNPGWSYDDFLPYFKNMENSSMTEDVDLSYHGTHGPLHVEHVRNFGEMGQAFLDASVEKGGRILDYNGRDEMGCSRMQTTTMNGRRCAANKVLLNPVIMRENLDVVTGAFVTKLNVEPGALNKVASVEFLLKDKKYIAKSKFEIILSAGVIGSAQILLHSGIGPKEDLQELDIKVVKDLPVGKNLHDHPLILYPFSTNYTDPSYKPLDQMVSDYLNGFGFLTTTANIQTIGFLNLLDPNNTVPDLEQFASAYLYKDTIFQYIFNINNETLQDIKNGLGNSSSVYYQILLHPKSRGSVKLKSANVFDHPLIDENFYSNPEDLEIMIRGLKFFLTFFETNAMKRFNATVPNNPLRSCPQKFLSDEYLWCYLLQLTSTVFHAAGTCKMGPDTDPEAVVDDRLKVKGFENLRVIDGSIMPEPISGHPTATVYAIAAKGANMIKEDWQKN